MIYKTTPIEKSFLRVLGYKNESLSPFEVLKRIAYVNQENFSAAKFVLDRLVTVGLAREEDGKYYAT